MGKEKKSSFLPLIYREYCITKKPVLSTVIFFIVMYSLCIMYSLSARFGNIAKIEDNSVLSSFVQMMDPMIHMMGIMFSFIISMSASDGTTADLKNKTWRLYRKSLPVKPFTLAMAKVTYHLTAFCSSIALSVIYLLIDGLISGKSISRADVGMIAAISAAVTLMCVSITIFVELLRSYDKGGLAAMGVFGAAAAAVILPNKGEQSGLESVSGVTEMLSSVAGYAPAIAAFIALLFVIEAVSLTLMYKRRDK